VTAAAVPVGGAAGVVRGVCAAGPVAVAAPVAGATEPVVPLRGVCEVPAAGPVVTGAVVLTTTATGLGVVTSTPLRGVCGGGTATAFGVPAFSSADGPVAGAPVFVSIGCTAAGAAVAAVAVPAAAATPIGVAGGLAVTPVGVPGGRPTALVGVAGFVGVGRTIGVSMGAGGLTGGCSTAAIGPVAPAPVSEPVTKVVCAPVVPAAAEAAAPAAVWALPF
jgi:hypothetical protein